MEGIDNRSQKEIQDIVQKIVESEEGQKLINKHVLAFTIHSTIGKDPVMSFAQLIRNSSVQNGIDKILYDIYDKENIFLNLSTSDCVNIYVQFACFVKYMSDKLKKEGGIQAFKAGSLDELISKIENTIDNSPDNNPSGDNPLDDDSLGEE